MKTPVYIALAAAAALVFALAPAAKAAGVYGGTYDRGYDGSYYSSSNVGMTDATRSDNLDQGRLDSRGAVGGYYPGGSPGIDRSYSEYETNRRGTDWDVGMTHPQFSDNLDQGRLDRRGQVGGRIEGSPGIDRSNLERRDRFYGEAPAFGPMYDVNTLIGSEVVDTHGNHLATIDNLVSDQLGRIDFAVLNTGTRDIAVPFQTLTYDNMGHYTLNMTEQQLAEAPAFDHTYLADRTWPDQVYRYYGITPRW